MGMSQRTRKLLIFQTIYVDLTVSQRDSYKTKTISKTDCFVTKALLSAN